MENKKTILITGTTSGIGLGLLSIYYKLGWNIICVNHRADAELEKKYAGAIFKTIHITEYAEVESLLRELDQAGLFPQYFALNAGINQPDHLLRGFDFSTFERVIRTNLLGVFSFISAARGFGKSGLVFLGISSSSNICPNPGHTAYYISKLAIFRGMRLMRKNDAENEYKVVILGPTATKINRSHPLPGGLAGKVLAAITTDCDEASSQIARFLESKKQILLFPAHVIYLYFFIRLFTSIFPSSYPGTRLGNNTK